MRAKIEGDKIIVTAEPESESEASFMEMMAFAKKLTAQIETIEGQGIKLTVSVDGAWPTPA